MKVIMVVDDEDQIRELLKEKLLRAKYEALLASSGQEALDICKDRILDLILLDIAMSGMDGYQTAEKLRQLPRHKNTPIIFLTGKDIKEEAIIRRCELVGNCEFVNKFITLKELQDKK